MPGIAADAERSSRSARRGRAATRASRSARRGASSSGSSGRWPRSRVGAPALAERPGLHDCPALRRHEADADEARPRRCRSTCSTRRGRSRSRRRAARRPPRRGPSAHDAAVGAGGQTPSSARPPLPSPDHAARPPKAAARDLRAPRAAARSALVHAVAGTPAAASHRSSSASAAAGASRPRLDGADPDPQRDRDLVLRELEQIAEQQHVPEARRQREDRLPDLEQALVLAPAQLDARRRRQARAARTSSAALCAAIPSSHERSFAGCSRRGSPCHAAASVSCRVSRASLSFRSRSARKRWIAGPKVSDELLERRGAAELRAPDELGVLELGHRRVRSTGSRRWPSPT